MESTKKMTITKLDGTTVEVVLKTQVSAWDAEQVEQVYSSYMIFDEATGQARLDIQRGVQIARDKEHKLVELFVVSMGDLQSPKAEDIMKELSRGEYTTLLSEIEKIFENQKVDDKKKEILPNSSSDASQPVEAKVETTPPTNQ